MDQKANILDPTPTTPLPHAPPPPPILSYYTPPPPQPPAEHSPEAISAFTLSLIVGGLSLIAAIVPWQPVLLVCGILIIVTSPLVFFLGIAGLFERQHKRSLAAISIPLLLASWLLAMFLAKMIN